MGKLLTNADFQKVGDTIADTIVKRTRRGISVTGDKFKRKANGTASTLTDTGKLLGSISAKAVKDGAVITARTDYAKHVAVERPFMGLTTREEDMIERMLLSMLDDNERQYRKGIK